MEIIIGKTSGFCFGVKNAVDKATEELKNSSSRVYCLGELVHNKQVTNSLKENGLIFIDNIDEAKGKTIIRAHGIQKETYQKARKLDIELKDLTCPKVLKIHDIAEEYSNNGYYIFLVGIKNHPETIGTYSFCGDNSSIIEDIYDLEQAVNKFKQTNIKKALLITQTTFSLNGFEQISEKLQKKLHSTGAELEVINSICPSTELRQKETEKLSQEVELMIIVGGKNSSNTKKLYEISLKNCKNVISVETKEDIEMNYIKQFERIGIMAGASTPIKSINDIIDFIKNETNVELLDVLDEEGKLTGQKVERTKVHEKNLWHIHVGIWIMNEKGELLFQKRSPNKKVNPNKWTRTGGHVDSGETALIGIQRETEEEIGVKIPIDSIELINIKKQPKGIGKHFTYSYFTFVKYKLEDYTMQPEEVSDLKYMTIEEMVEAYEKQDSNYTFTGWEDFDQTIEFLKNKRKELII